MPPIRDVAEIARRVVRLNLGTDDQVLMAREELAESERPTAENFCRILERRGWLTPLQTQKLLKGDTEGYFLGGYRLLYRIASGSFGRVFRADDPRTGQVVAIKVLRKRWSEKPRSVALFEREGRIGLSMRHPNVVQILAVSRDAASKQHYLVMEFVEGGNLRDFLSIRKKLEPLEAVRLLEETAAGLAYAYSRGLTHRDMKPTNILISSQGTAKLVDFGLTEVTGGAADDESDSSVDRSLDYAGLERATGVKAGDTRSDIFFLGAVVFEMLTGKPPLPPTKDKVARVARERFENLPSIREELPGLAPELASLVDKMLAFEPTARHQTPQQLLEAVQEVHARLNGTATPPCVEQRPNDGVPTVYVVEDHPRLRETIREKLTGLGYRVEASGDSSLALRQFRQCPYQGLVIDVGSTGREGIWACNRILEEAESRGVPCGAILLLSEDQAGWTDRITARPNLAVMIRPVNLKQLLLRFMELTPRPQPKKTT